MLKANCFVKINPARRFLWVPLALLLSLFVNTGFAQSPCDFTYINADEISCTFQFTSQVKGVPGLLLSHEWYFGDGSSSTVANPLHSYPSTSTGGGTQIYQVVHILTTTDPFTMATVAYPCTTYVTVYETDPCLLCPTINEGTAIFDYKIDGCVINATSNIANLNGVINIVWNIMTPGMPPGVTVYGNPLNYTFPGDGIYKVSMSAANPMPPYTAYRCERMIKVDCSTPNSDFTWTDGTGACGCFGLEVFPVTIDPEAVYGWYVNGELVSTDVHPNLFPNGLNLCEIQESGGTIEVSLVLQLAGESSMTTHTIDLSNAPRAIYIGAGAGITTQLSDYEDVLPGSSYCDPSCDVRVCGMIEVDKDFEFCGGVDVEVSAGLCGFEVNDTRTFAVTGASHLHGCNCLWQGITAKPGSTVRVNGNSIIEDAAYAIWTKFDAINNLSANLWLNDADLKNNYIGVRVDGNLNLAEFTHNLFISNKTLFQDCEHLLKGLEYSMTLGYAGMQIDHDGATMNLVNDANQNIFDNLAVGIYSRDGTLNLQPCCTFQNLTSCAYQTGAPDGAGSRGVWFVNDNAFTSTGNIFNNVQTGILGTTNVPTAIDINNNNMPSVSRGIDLRTGAGGRMTGSVNNNNVTVNINPCIGTLPGLAYGIAFEDNTTQVNDMTINSNPVSVNYSGVTGFTSYGIYLNQESTANNAQVQVEVMDNNAINMKNGFAGIHVRRFIRAAVYSNTVNWTGTGPFGILVDAGRNNFICSNNINGGGTGLRIIGSQTATIQSNTMTNTGIGASLSGNCGFDTNFGCNTFAGTQGYGLFYDALAQVGIQTDWEINAGNEWTGTFTAARAHINLLSSIPNNIFFVPTGHPTLDPGNTQMFGGQRWFVAEDWITPGDCSGNTCAGFERPAGKRNNAVQNANVPQAQSDIALQIAPNPNAGDFIVTFDKNPDDAAELQVVSVSGSLVKSYQVQPGETTYRISGIAPGIYFVKMTSNGKTSAPVKMVIF